MVVTNDGGIFLQTTQRLRSSKPNKCHEIQTTMSSTNVKELTQLDVSTYQKTRIFHIFLFKIPPNQWPVAAAEKLHASRPRTSMSSFSQMMSIITDETKPMESYPRTSNVKLTSYFLGLAHHSV